MFGIKILRSTILCENPTKIPLVFPEDVVGVVVVHSAKVPPVLGALCFGYAASTLRGATSHGALEPESQGRRSNIPSVSQDLSHVRLIPNGESFGFQSPGQWTGDTKMHATKNRNSPGTLLEPFAVGLQSWANEANQADLRFQYDFFGTVPLHTTRF